MALRAKLKQETLVELGAERLARLIIEEASRNPPFKRIATAALAAADGPDAVAASAASWITTDARPFWPTSNSWSR